MFPTADPEWISCRDTAMRGEICSIKRAEGALRQSRENLTAALAASDTGTFRWNLATGEFSEFDESLKRLFGLPPKGRCASRRTSSTYSTNLNGDRTYSLATVSSRVAFEERASFGEAVSG